MLEELVVEEGGQRYVGRVWGGTGRPLLAGQPVLRWCFAHHGQVIAEFPATPLDTAEVVKVRLLSIIARIHPSETN